MTRIGLITGTCLLVAFAACGEKKKKEQPKKPTAEAPKAEAPKAEAPKAEGPPTDTVSVIVVHEVENFDKWKAAFDADANARKASGAIWHSISRDVDKENKVTIHIVGTDMAKAKAFVASDDLEKAMKEAGVKGPPEIMFANDVTIDSPRGAIEGETFSMIGTHEVEDFDKWKTAFDADAEARKSMGIVGGSVSRALDNPNLVVFHFVVTDPKKVQEGLGSDDMKKKMAEAGVKGPLVVAVSKDVEQSTY